jgi:hypothetical protein
MTDRKMTFSEFLAVITCCLSLVLLQITINSWFDANRLRDELRITKEAMKIADDQIRDITYELQQARVADEADHTRWFVAGVVSAAERPEYYNEIWHAGYDRGSAVQAAANELEKKSAAFTTDK